MKSIFLALAAILATTATAWAAPAPAPLALTHSQLVAIVHADVDPNSVPGFVGAHIALDLRPSAIQPHFVAAGHVHGTAFICQSGFDGFDGGPVAATLVAYEPGEDGRDFVNLTGCTPLER